MTLEAPTIRQLIEAIEEGIVDLNQANTLTQEPTLYAAEKNTWAFVSNGQQDPRVAKFKAMGFEGFALANERYLALKHGSGAEAAATYAQDCAKLMCAAASIVKWKRPAGATDDSYLDKVAQLP